VVEATLPMRMSPAALADIDAAARTSGRKNATPAIRIIELKTPPLIDACLAYRFFGRRQRTER
jgi:hypothetical protein